MIPLIVLLIFAFFALNKDYFEASGLPAYETWKDEGDFNPSLWVTLRLWFFGFSYIVAT